MRGLWGANYCICLRLLCHLLYRLPYCTAGKGCVPRRVREAEGREGGD